MNVEDLKELALKEISHVAQPHFTLLAQDITDTSHALVFNAFIEVQDRYPNFAQSRCHSCKHKKI